MPSSSSRTRTDDGRFTDAFIEDAQRDIRNGEFFDKLEMRPSDEREGKGTSPLVDVTLRWEEGNEAGCAGDMPISAAGFVPLLEAIRRVYAPQLGLDYPQFVSLRYGDRVVRDGDTLDSLGAGDGDVVHLGVSLAMRIVFVVDGESSDVDGIPVTLTLGMWSGGTMKEAFARYASQAAGGGAARLSDLRFSLAGVPLDSLENATPRSLGILDGDEIRVTRQAGGREPEGTAEPRKKPKNAKSRKKKGKKTQRREAPPSPWRERWAHFLLTGGGTGGDGKDAPCCSHGCELDALGRGHPVTRWIDAYLDALLISKARAEGGVATHLKGSVIPVLHPLCPTYECAEEVWAYKKFRELAIRVLVGMGTNAVLSRMDDDMAEIAAAIVHLERFREGNQGLRFGAATKETIARQVKVQSGGRRELVRFYSKRTPCDCLKEGYHELKAQARIGACHFCGEVVDRAQLKVCSLCNFTRYCSVTCQKADWKDHKSLCKSLGDGNTVVGFYPRDDGNACFRA